MADFWEIYDAVQEGVYVDPDKIRSQLPDEYVPEFEAAYSNYLSAISASNRSYSSKKKVSAAVGAAEQAFWDSVSSMFQSIRERDQASVATQLEEQRAAGLNPLLNGVDSGAAATAGLGVDTNTPLDSSALPPVRSDLEVVGDVFSIVSSVASGIASIGLGIANTVMNIGATAARNVLTEEQAGMIREGRMIQAGMIAEQYVLDNAPQYDESLGSFPVWIPASIPGVSEDMQMYALDRARSYYGSDRHRSGQLSHLSSVEQSRYDLARLYGNGFYNGSLEAMSDSISRYSKLKLDMIETDYNRQISYNRLFDKYYTLLSPEAMAEVQNAVNSYGSSYYSALDGSVAAAAENASVQSQSDFFASYDSSLSASYQNATNRYGSILYDSLDAEGKAAYDNYFYELSKLQGQIVEDQLSAQNALFEEHRRNLNSPDPGVRIAAAKALQRCVAKSARRSSATGWQRFSQGARTVVGIGATVAGAAALVGGAAPAAAAAAGVGAGAFIMPDESTFNTDPYSVLNGL